ncbi:CU044_5270 family protein [Nonomuraea sp. GTA35]|uniref:CU044_5270 family protein n=1 Tax=Nonomuraea sp. GTA35 TaxID=1676746 RepID=UPI0035C08673
MDDEIRVFAEGRPEAPPYGAEARARARERLLTQARGGGGRFRLPRLGWQAAAAFGVTVVLVGGVAVALSNQGAGPGPATSATQSAEVTPGELHPRPGQFIMVESETMYGSFTMGADGKEASRHLYRSHRKIWQSVDGSASGLLMMEGREPRPWPGEELPEAEKTGWQGTSWDTLAACPGRLGEYRTDYAYLSTLPADPAALRERLYRLGGKGGDRDFSALDHARSMLTETYLPRAQRQALFEAIKTIPGVRVEQGVEDAAGREGVALAGPGGERGVESQLIFDPETFMYLGERQEVVAEGAAAPKGSILALTAQLSVSVVDRLPEEAAQAQGDASCMPESEVPADAPPQSPASDAPTEVASPAPDAPAETASPAPHAPTEIASPAPDAPAETASPAPDAPTASAVPESADADMPTAGPVPTVTD